MDVMGRLATAKDSQLLEREGDVNESRTPGQSEEFLNFPKMKPQSPGCCGTGWETGDLAPTALPPAVCVIPRGHWLVSCFPALTVYMLYVGLKLDCRGSQCRPGSPPQAREDCTH